MRKNNVIVIDIVHCQTFLFPLSYRETAVENELYLIQVIND